MEKKMSQQAELMSKEYRATLVQDIVDNMDEWDQYSLLQWAQCRMEDLLEKLTDEELQAEWESLLEDEWDETDIYCDELCDECPEECCDSDEE